MYDKDGHTTHSAKATTESSEVVREDGALKRPVSLNGQTVNVDVQFAPLIKVLNEQGYRTKNSCSGIEADHEGTAGHYGYIQFDEQIDEQRDEQLKQAADEAGLAYHRGQFGELVVEDRQLADGRFVQHSDRTDTVKDDAAREAREQLDLAEDELEQAQRLLDEYNDLIAQFRDRDEQLVEVLSDAQAERRKDHDTPEESQTGAFVRSVLNDERVHERLQQHIDRLADRSGTIDDPEAFLGDMIEGVARAYDRIQQHERRASKRQAEMVDESEYVDEETRKERWKQFLNTLQQ